VEANANTRQGSSLKETEMKSFTESEIKYLAGLLDADGSLSFKFCPSSSGKTFVYLMLSLSAAESVDRGGYLKSLADRCGSLTHTVYEKETYSAANSWKVQKRSEVNMLLDRLVKHMVIKGKHWKCLQDKFNELKGIDVTDTVAELKLFSQESRKSSGPLKPKVHPTWAWAAGYLDGDGCYTCSKVKHLGCITHKDDLDGVKLLHKAFGGTIYPERLQDNTVLWRVGLGAKNRGLALSILPKLHRHSRLKKWKIEQLIAFHNQPHRLSEIKSTD
jgi:hypothetical protein